ncbi:uncharacterized protein N7483_012919 [Penicillium malachiteum]|uniref:uncharacterized protein n=1 Tax=Penicillium malachiteum TaxID=1324776 RepID=UPI002546F1F0|nr:uncharacterized protein N7483_012919 [Penicillium malachiteum]KAJ5715738.1 hypothetical protein N7483_012919 [Penicillium malachiteum]
MLCVVSEAGENLWAIQRFKRATTSSNPKPIIKLYWSNKQFASLPPDGAKVSDEQVYLIVKLTSHAECYKRWPEVFKKAEDIKDARQPHDPAPLALAFGLPFYFVYKDYYVSCGKNHQKPLESTRLGQRQQKYSKGHTTSLLIPSSPPLMREVERNVLWS